MPDKEMASGGLESAMLVLCTWLGEIPVGPQPIHDHRFPAEWVSFSADEWEQFISKAQEQGLAPLLYWVLSKSGNFSSIPESTRNSLRIKYAATWINNQAILKELETLAEAFKQAGIPMVVLKGACFAQTIYPDIGLRSMGDLDVLVPVSKVSEAVRIARLFGYFEYVEAEPEASPGLRGMFNKDVCLQKSDPHLITLEIHTSLVANRSFRYAVPIDWFWEQVEPMRTISMKSEDPKLFMLSPTAQILYGIAHLMFQHEGYEAPLRWFYDLDRLVRFYSGRLDWDLLLSQARIFEWGVGFGGRSFQNNCLFWYSHPGTCFDRLERYFRPPPGVCKAQAGTTRYTLAGRASQIAFSQLELADSSGWFPGRSQPEVYALALFHK